MMINVLRSSETSVTIYQSIRRNNREILNSPQTGCVDNSSHMQVCLLNSVTLQWKTPQCTPVLTHFADHWITYSTGIEGGTAVARWLRCCATNRKVAGSIPASVNGFFIDIKYFWSHYGPGVDSASNRNEYREYFLRGKGGRCVRLTTLPPSCAVVT